MFETRLPSSLLRMHIFRVWVQPQQDQCRIRVEGAANTKWLLQRLSQSFVFRSFEPMGAGDADDIFTFQVPCNPPMTPKALQRLLLGMPEVQLMRLAE